MIVRKGAGLIVAFLIVSSANAQSPPQTPVLRLFLPGNIPSDKIEVDYALYGTFGAHSRYGRAKPDSAFVEIPLVVEGSTANEVKVLAWAPGCRVEEFDIKVGGLDLHDSYSCDQLPFVLLAGQVDQSVALRQRRTAEVRVDYLAGWGCSFFGFSDCMVPQFSIGTAKIDPTGRFEISLPDFSSDPAYKALSATDGFEIVLRQVNTEDISLRPRSKLLRTLDGSLKAASVYPNPVLFVANKSN
jgi:hypothetical protein